MKNIFLLLSFTLFFAYSFSSSAQTDPCVRTSEGREFWVGFMDHEGTLDIETKLYVTSRVATTGTVSADGGTNNVANINVAANGSQEIDLTPASDYLVNTAQRPQARGVFVTTNDPLFFSVRL